MKHKINETVRIISVEEYNDKRGENDWFDVKFKYNGSIDTESFVENMSDFCGKFAKIVDIRDGRYFLDIDNGVFFWVDDFFDDVIVANDIDDVETINIRLRKDHFPKLFQKKLDELLESGAFDNEESATRWIEETPITLELFYEKDSGLFAVEMEAVDTDNIVSPYSQKTIVVSDSLA